MFKTDQFSVVQNHAKKQNRFRLFGKFHQGSGNQSNISQSRTLLCNIYENKNKLTMQNDLGGIYGEITYLG
jgi:hypothetical protein